MTGLERPGVVAAAGAWILAGPPGTTEVDGEGWKAVHLPYGGPDLLQLLWVRSRRPVARLLDEVRAAVADLGPETMLVYVKLDAPRGLEPELVARGASLVDTCDVLAMPIGQAGTEERLADPPPGLGLRWCTTTEAARTIGELMVEAFGGDLPTGEDLDHALERRVREGRAAQRRGRGGALLASIDDVAVGTASLELVDGVARFAGGAVRRAYQGQGLYRALVDARLGYAAEHGARMALAFGRVTTSSPILRRMGFESVGQERIYRLPLR